MMNIKRGFLLLVLAFSLLACKKSSDTQINEFITGYNSAVATRLQGNPAVKSSSATKSGPNEVSISMQLNSEKDDMETELLKKSFPQILGQIISSMPNGSKFNDDIDIKFILFDKNGNQISSDKIDKNAKQFKDVDVANLGKGQMLSKGQLNEMLDVFNKNLPMTDPSTGLKVLKMEAGNDNDVMYSVEVPQDLKDVIKTDAARELMKEEMLKSGDIKQILLKSSDFGVNKLTYLYKDDEGNILNKIILDQKDIR